MFLQIKMEMTMTDMQVLVLAGVIALVVAGAGFSVVMPRRFTDRDADGEPDLSPDEAARARERDAAERGD